MSKGKQIYPKADAKTQWYGGRYPGAAMEVNVGIVHTTEGTGWPSYSGGGVAPTITARPNFSAKKLEFRQHFNVDRSARALVNAAGGVETNTANVFQIELVGTCDPATHAKWARAGYSHIYWPDAPEWALRDLAELMTWLKTEHGIPLKSGLRFLPYPRSYGATATRLTAAQWRIFRGWAGHQHVPENSHGDPGNFPIEEVLGMAAALVKPKPKPAAKPAALDPKVKPGARHPQVKVLQQLLVEAGYGPIKGAVTDYYGPATQGAVAKFHAKHPEHKKRLRPKRITPEGFIALQKEAK
ncbi:peptidoglycan-binding domain-containing protein [Actinocorallia libanotica]|uniref:Peptidoglycan binding-like domain-containing protein n=1 Tax=Actinocorallia libanotica TaxID=46162 RepID=A0ABP4CH26_9ACTN